MSQSYIPVALRRLVADPLQIDHILPTSDGGESVLSNLCLAWARCNLYKGTKQHGTDPETNLNVSLFNPREMEWNGMGCSLRMA